MAWNDAPPTPEELAAKPTSSPTADWTKEPPTPQELAGSGPPVVEPGSTPTEHSSLTAGIGGAFQGATFNMAPRIWAAGAAPVRYFTDEQSVMPELNTLGEKYGEEKQKAENLYKGLEEQSPISYNVGQLGAGAATALIPGLGEASIVSKLKTASPIIKAGVRGAIEGGLYGAGATEDLTNMPQAAENIGGGALAGGALAGVGAKIFAPKERAIQLIGATPGQVKIMNQSGVKILNPDGTITSSSVSDYLPQWLKDKVSIWNTKGGIEQSMDKVRNDAGNQIDSAIRSYEKGPTKTIAKQLGITEPTFDFNALADKLENEIIKPHAITPSYDAEIKKAHKFIQDIKALGGTTTENSLTELTHIRRNWDDKINWKIKPEDDYLENLAMKQARSDVQDHIIDNMFGTHDKLLNITGKVLSKDGSNQGSQTLAKILDITGNLKKQIINANTDYTMAKHIEPALEGEVSRISKNKLSGLTDWGLISGGVAGHLDPATIAQGLGLKKLAEYAGPRLGVQSAGSSTTQRLLQSAGGLKAPLITKGIGALNSSDSSAPQQDDVTSKMDLMKQDPKYSTTLMRANGDSHLESVYHNILMKTDPEYRQKYMGDEQK